MKVLSKRAFRFDVFSGGFGVRRWIYCDFVIQYLEAFFVGYSVEKIPGHLVFELALFK